MVTSAPSRRTAALSERRGVLLVGDVAGGVDRAAFGPRALGAIQQLVLEDHHGVVVADGRLEDALGVVGVGDGDHSSGPARR